MDRNASFRMFVAAFIVLWSSSFIIRYKVQGEMALTRHRQCKLRGFDTACSSCTDDSCTELKCGRSRGDGTFMEVVIKPAGGVMEGTPCGERKACQKKRCRDITLGCPTYIGDNTVDECKPIQPVLVSHTRTEQCKRRGFAGVCKMSAQLDPDTICDTLYCARETNGIYYLQKIIPIWGVDIGTHCGENQICIHRQCVDVVGAMPATVGDVNVRMCQRAKILPGKAVKTRHEQCVDHGFDVACKDNASPDARCSRLNCGYQIFPGYYLMNIRRLDRNRRIYPLTGTKCGEFHTCQLKKCEATLPNKMPTYIGDDIYHDCYKSNFHDKIMDN